MRKLPRPSSEFVAVSLYSAGSVLFILGAVILAVGLKLRMTAGQPVPPFARRAPAAAPAPLASTEDEPA